jgi:hypothetical protein
MALVVIAVQHGVVRTIEHRVDLPSEVRRVLDVGVHTLTAHWGMDVRRVAGQEHATMPIPRDLSFIAMESGLPPYLEQAQIGLHRPHQDAGDFILIHGLGVGNLIVAVPQHRAVPRPVGVAAAGGSQERELIASAAECQAAAGRTIRQLDIGQHDRRQDRLTREVRTYQRADRTVRTVGYTLVVPPLAGMDDAQLIEWLRPVLAHYLADPAP